MKKVTIALSLLVLLTVLAAGCGGSAESAAINYLERELGEKIDVKETLNLKENWNDLTSGVGFGTSDVFEELWCIAYLRDGQPWLSLVVKMDGQWNAEATDRAVEANCDMWRAP